MIKGRYTTKDFENLPAGTLIKYINSLNTIVEGKFLSTTIVFNIVYGEIIEVWAYWGGKSHPTWVPLNQICHIKKELQTIDDPEFESLYV